MGNTSTSHIVLKVFETFSGETFLEIVVRKAGMGY